MADPLPVQGGRLKLKGEPLKELGKKRKGKKRKEHEERQLAVVDEAPAMEVPKTVDPRTPAEKAYDRAMAERAPKRHREAASISYRDRIDDYNAKIATLTEHHDIPRVGPG
eukprot:TRINITY_DN3679_c0_g1_i1.p2 TRINITY_DN3679_c0_g1~~TRINITY_DN3679_c0_g1_i1.p2  ORF type:complete len:111 (-),score=20.17 TRINITY_DN3679_c0_g1_i1:34-366(-)